MWNILNGTIVNVLAVAVGSGTGLLLSARIPDRYQQIILNCLGLVTITLGIDASVLVMSETARRYGEGIPTYGARLAMVTVGSLIVGAMLGTALRLHDRIEGLGCLIHSRLGASGHDARQVAMAAPQRGTNAISATESPQLAGRAPAGRFAEGFLSASVIFCVGPLTLLGCLQNGGHGNPSLLYIKSFLDGFCSMALAASLGAGVFFSVVTVLFFQGGLALAAWQFAGMLPDLSLQLMNVVGGVVLLATALMILNIKKIPVADLLPGIFLPPVVIWLVERISPGILLTGG